MNKRLEEILQRVAQWPPGAQEDAAFVLADIEDRIVEPGELSAEDQAKLTALREMINKSIERGGSFTDEEIETSIDARLDAWERDRKGT
jgi:hypothetical protein